MYIMWFYSEMHDVTCTPVSANIEQNGEQWNNELVVHYNFTLYELCSDSGKYLKFRDR